MRHGSLSVLSSGMLLWLGTADAGPSSLDQLLHGDYGYTSEFTCLYSPVGFNPDFTPIDGRSVVSLTSRAIRTFTGDGTGSISGATQSVAHPDAPNVAGAASSSTFEASFTYGVAPDGTLTVTRSAPTTGTFLSGPRVGQTFTQDGAAVTTGFVSDDHKTLTLTKTDPAIEVTRYSNGDINFRICTGSTTLVRLPRGH